MPPSLGGRSGWGVLPALLAFALAPPASHGAFDVNEESYSSHELSDITASVQLDAVNGTVVALGDFNSDQYTDLIILSAERDVVSVMLWEHEERRFVPGPSVAGLNRVLNVVATDLNRDGQLDLLLVRERSGSSKLSDNGCTLLTFLPGYISEFGEPISLPPAYGQPLVVNLDADPATDLFGEACADDDKLIGRGVRSIWHNDGQGRFTRRDAQLGSLPLAGVPSPAAVDIDGDCRADLVVPVLSGGAGSGDVSSYGAGGTSWASGSASDGARNGGSDVHLEIWISQSDGLGGSSRPLRPAAVVPLPRGVQQLVWADINADGGLDALAPLCDAHLGCGIANANQTEKLKLVQISTYAPLRARGSPRSHACVRDAPSPKPGWSPPALARGEGRGRGWKACRGQGQSKGTGRRQGQSERARGLASRAPLDHARSRCPPSHPRSPLPPPTASLPPAPLPPPPPTAGSGASRARSSASPTQTSSCA
jgi:hypothetical protein